MVTGIDKRLIFTYNKKRCVRKARREEKYYEIRYRGASQCGKEYPF